MRKYSKPIYLCVRFIILKINAVLNFIYKKTLQPLGRCLKYVFVTIIYKRIIYKYILMPLNEAGKCFVQCLKYLYVKLIKPILKVLYYIIFNPLRIACNAVKKILSSTYSYFEGIVFGRKTEKKQEKPYIQQKKQEIIYFHENNEENLKDDDHVFINIDHLGSHNHITHPTEGTPIVGLEIHGI